MNAKTGIQIETAEETTAPEAQPAEPAAEEEALSGMSEEEILAELTKADA